MASTIIKRQSICFTKESKRQLEDLCINFGENPNQVVNRCIQIVHYSVRFPNVSVTEIIEKDKK